MTNLLALCCSLSLVALAHPAAAAPPQASADAEEGEVKFDLETVFDEDGLFGPSASAPSFSASGRYAAYLYRPYPERRHGSDLWLVDLGTGQASRLTSVSVMAPFQASTMKVGEDRIKRAKKAVSAAGDDGAKSAGEEAAGKKQPAGPDDDRFGGGSWSELQELSRKGEARTIDREDDDSTDDLGLMDVVGDEDADEKKAPRYRGISSFTWAPGADELLMSSGGDIYRWVIGEDRPVRLTKTRQSERSVQYLPDGAGYTALLDDALVRVRFGDHFVDQLDPKLPGGMTMREYKISPDGERVAFVASNGSRSREGGRTVDIATYNDRFMKVRTVPRTVSDDPIGKRTTAVFLHELPDPDREDGELVKVYERETSGPRDVLRVPDWAPDSTRVVFAAFDQATEEVHVLEALADEPGEGGSEAKDEATGAPEGERPARVIQRFLHTGGPNTPRMIEPRYLADSRRIMLITEQTGFRHLHVLDPVYETLEPVTRGRFEVYPIGTPEDRSCAWVAATREDSACQDVYRVDLDTAEMTRLTGRRGQYAGAAVSPDGQHLLATFSAFGSPRELVHVDIAAGEERALTDSHPAATRELTAIAPEFFEFENRHGQGIRGLMFEPERESGEKRPLLIYVYGGPLGTRKQVTEGNFGSDGYFFARYMAQEHGWVTCTIDPRGMSGYGALFEKANFERVGVPQVEDLTDGVRFLIKEHGVDADRVAIHGWSFGGFQTQMCLYTEPEVFRCGIAGAGPTEWENYNSWYSTGTIGNSREGETDLKEFSLLPLAKNLQSKLLLVHGMEDSNVLYQDTVRVYAELLDAGKETLVELFVDPSGGHGLGGHVKRLGRFRKYEEFLLRANQ
ncbi:prolyl oligopeptidase family serine peptidase [Planctomycetota bacterium]|nr:prolyl oligopeptidase family serine peptidase [Planctomycetota bacterium]